MSNLSYITIWLENDNRLTVPITMFDEIASVYMMYIDQKQDSIITGKTCEGYDYCFAVSRLIIMMSFTPETRRLHQEITYSIDQEIREMRMEIGGLEWVEKDS